jgi:hypothetical protein
MSSELRAIPSKIDIFVGLPCKSVVASDYACTFTTSIVAYNAGDDTNIRARTYTFYALYKIFGKVLVYTLHLMTKDLTNTLLISSFGCIL